MKRGFTLVEIMASLLIGMLILGGTLMVATHHEKQNKRLRSLIRLDSQLVTAQETLARMTWARETQFWRSYPPHQLPIHKADHWHDGFHFTKNCPKAPKGSCFVFWDVIPPTAGYGFYKIVPFVNEQGAVQLNPVADRFPSGAHAEVLPSSILFTLEQEKAQPRLVADVLPDRVRWIANAQRIWQPTDAWSEKARTVHLGRLSLLHVQLQKDLPGQFKLMTQIWELTANGWRAKPRVSLQARLVDTIWRPCQDERGDRMVLVAQVSEQRAASQITTIENRDFLGEVRFVEISF